MNKIKIYFMVLVVSIVMILIIGCGKKPEPIVGSWALESAIDYEGNPLSKEKLQNAGIDLSAIFSDDNTCAFDSPQFGEEINGTWSVTTSNNAEKSKVYSAKADDGSIAIQFYFLNDDYFNLYGEFYGMSVTMIRK